MKPIRTSIMLVVALSLGLSAVARAETDPATRDELARQLAALNARLAGLEQQDSNAWLNQRRAEEVKALVRDVLADADTRASLLQEGATAGHNGKHFFLASQDGSFLMNVSGQIQLRYVWNDRNAADSSDGSDVGDADEFGFEIPRAKIQFKGHIGSPKFTYDVRLAVDGANNNIVADTILVGHQLADGLWLVGGEGKAPFLREELTESYHQLAVERSLMNEVFTLGYVQGIWVKWDPCQYAKIAVSINDGLRSGEASGAGGFKVRHPDPSEIGDIELTDGVSKNFASDSTDFALTARMDVKVAGDWAQMQDFSAWSGEPMGVFVGAAIHYEVGETGDGQASAQDLAFPGFVGSHYDRFLTWTVDGSVEWNGFNAYAAFVGTHTDATLGGNSVDHYGAIFQAGYMVIPDKLEPFARVEWISIADPDSYFDSGNNDLTILTFGANYYVNKHNAKFTVDVVWALESIQDGNIDQHPIAINDPSNVNLLFDDTGKEDQVAVRAQFQLLF